MFSAQLIDYTHKNFARNRVEVLTQTRVLKVEAKCITVLGADDRILYIPYGTCLSRIAFP